MKLSELINEVEYISIENNAEKEISSLVYDSRKAGPGSLFVCISGANSDGHDYAAPAAEKGVAAIVAQKKIDASGTTVIYVKDSRKALAQLSASWFGHPDRKLTTIGITGTKGKTTTSCMIRNMLEASGHKTGLIGTIGIFIGDKKRAVPNTTPESYIIHEAFRQMVDEGCDCAVMEVSSQALKLERTCGICFDYGIFTNLSRDHIGENEHENMEDYVRCKSLLFTQCQTGLFNADDEYFPRMKENASCRVETFGLKNPADYRASDIQYFRNAGTLGMTCRLSGKLNMNMTVDLPGAFSVYNALVSAALCTHFGVKKEVIKEALSKVRVKGRAELVDVSPKFTVMIDYAHNSVSLKSLLLSLREYHPKRLVCIFGCGGNRSKERRYEMGRVSSNFADLTIVTSDNPRFENPQDIINDILTGIRLGNGKYEVIPDRAQAVRFAVENAREGDIIVLAGKGHEDYQEIRGKKYHMDERTLIENAAKDGNFIR